MHLGVFCTDTIYQQIRGFKTKRSGATGITTGSGTKIPVGKIDKVKVPASAIASVSHISHIFL